MTWKSTALVSGVGVLATWLASVPPPGGAPEARPARANAASSAPANTAVTPTSVDADIEREASRLARRTAQLAAYAQPVRNPFRFSSLPRTSTRASQTATAVPTPAPAPVVPAQPVIRLVGVAMDRPDGVEVWTAILSTGDGVVLARVGEVLSGGTSVTAIGADRVELRHPDGSSSSLPLAGK